MDDAATIAGKIETDLRVHADAERAAGQKRYLKSDLKFLGATVGDVRKVTATALRQAGVTHHDEVAALVDALWDSPVFERRLAAAVTLERKADVLDSHDLVQLKRLVGESGTWALVDVLAVNVVGRLAVRTAIVDDLDQWARDSDFWVRRTSLLAEIRPLKTGLPFAPFADRADLMLDEKEFFIRKAIGWVLREASKTRPDEVFGWLALRTARASGVTVREAVKYLGEPQRALIMRAYRDRRPAVHHPDAAPTLP
jgi:3-methyladenine DNA glycosylase AlkD